MNTISAINYTNSRGTQINAPSRRMVRACVASCRQLLSQMHRIKNTVLTEFRAMVGANDHLLRLAINEAEALARQTAYPHLLFPVLATEKAESVRSWHQRQQSLRRIQGRHSHSPFVSTH